MTDTPPAAPAAKAPYVDRRLLVKLDDLWNANCPGTGSLAREARLSFQRITTHWDKTPYPGTADYVGHLLQIEQVGFKTSGRDAIGLREIVGIKATYFETIKRHLAALNLGLHTREPGIDAWLATEFTGELPESLKNEPSVTPEELTEMLKGNFDTGPIGTKAIKATTPDPFGQIDRRLLVPLEDLWYATKTTPSNRLRNSLHSAKLTLDKDATAAATHILHVYQLGGGIKMQEQTVNRFGRRSRMELEEHFKAFGMDIENVPAESAAWASLPFTGELPDALQDQPPVTAEELEAMAKGDYKVKILIGAEAEAPNSFIDALTEAQRAYLENPVREIDNPKLLDLARDIRDNKGIITLPDYGITKLNMIGLAILGLEGTGTEYVFVEKDKGSKSVVAVISKRAAINFTKLGGEPYLDEVGSGQGPQTLNWLVDKKQTFTFPSGVDGEDFFATAYPERLQNMGFKLGRIKVKIIGLDDPA